MFSPAVREKRRRRRRQTPKNCDVSLSDRELSSHRRRRPIVTGIPPPFAIASVGIPAEDSRETKEQLVISATAWGLPLSKASVSATALLACFPSAFPPSPFFPTFINFPSSKRLGGVGRRRKPIPPGVDFVGGVVASLFLANLLSPTAALPLPGRALLSPPPPPPSSGYLPSSPGSRGSPSPTPTRTTLGSVESYLLKYGYITEETLRNLGPGKDDSTVLDSGSTIPTDRRRTRGWQSFTAGLTAFQRFASVPETGVLDNATITALQRPRCGMKDVDASIDFPLPLGSSRTRGRGRGRGPGRGRRQSESGETEWQSMAARYQLQGSKWNKNRVTWKISGSSQDLARTTQENIFTRAFQIWSKYTPLTFQKVCVSCPCDIEIKFAKWGHGDNDAFDGPSGVLAHAFYPRYGGDAHFDDDEFWTDRSNRGTNLFQVAVHEIGHSLGLKHSNRPSAIMAPFYKAFDPNFDLQQDDIQGIQALYGVRTAPTLLPPFNPDTPPSGGGGGGGGGGGSGGSGGGGGGDSGVYYPVRPPSPWWWYSYYYGYRPYSGSGTGTAGGGGGGGTGSGSGSGTSLQPQSQMGFPFNPFNGHLQLPTAYGYSYGKKK